MKNSLLIAYCLLASTQVLGKYKKINVHNELKKQEAIRLAQQAQFAAIRTQDDQERSKMALNALHCTLNASKNLNPEERDRQIRTLLNNSKEIFKSRETRIGVNNERIAIKKDKRTKNDTIKSKEFKDLIRLAAATGRLEESYAEFLSGNEEEQSLGNKKFKKALKRMQKIETPELKPFCKQIAQAKYIELSLAPYSKNIVIKKKHLKEINKLKDTL